jgi:endonuclease/exonuclease/phosphatase (EEP) superfamily protein YafD
MVDRYGVFGSLILPLGWLALAGLCVATGVHLLDLRTWPFELFHHFAPHYIVAALAVCLVFAGFRNGFSAATALTLALFFGAVYKHAPQPLEKGTLAPFGAAQAFDFEGMSSRTHRLTLITHNLMANNWRYRELYTWLASRPADVVVLQEVSTGLSAMLRNLSNIYPHQIIVGGNDPSDTERARGLEGVAVLSRHPVLEHKVLRPAGRLDPGLIARLSIAGADDPWLVVVHPWDPLIPANLVARDRYLAEIVEAITRLDGPVIIAGDFNATPYTPSFQALLKATRTTTFTEFPATFPATMGPLGIPIDHVLVRGIHLADLQALPSIGSDHRPLKALLFLPTAETDRAGFGISDSQTPPANDRHQHADSQDQHARKIRQPAGQIVDPVKSP